MSVCAPTAAPGREEPGGGCPEAASQEGTAQGDWVSEEAKAADRAVVPDVTVVLRETGSWPWAVPESTENGR